MPKLQREWAHPCCICIGTRLTPPTCAPGLSSPLTHLHQGGGRPSHGSLVLVCRSVGSSDAHTWFRAYGCSLRAAMAARMCALCWRRTTTVTVGSTSTASSRSSVAAPSERVRDRCGHHVPPAAVMRDRCCIAASVVPAYLATQTGGRADGRTDTGGQADTRKNVRLSCLW